MKKALFLVLLFSFIFNLYSQSQTELKDSAVFQSAYTNSLNLYHKAVAPKPALYNGVKYVYYPFSITEGHVYFIDIDPVRGTVIRNNTVFENVKLRYNLVRNNLVLNTDSGTAVLIHMDEIDGFSLYNYNFIKLLSDSTGLATGYYAVLYNGKTAVYWKPEKKLRSVLKETEELHYVDEKNHYYIKKGNVYFSVSKKSHILKVLKDKKSALQGFMRREKLVFDKRYFAESLAKTAAYYDGLNN